MNRTILCLLIVICFAGAASAQVQWDDEGGDGDWFTALNWVGDVVPDPCTYCMVSGAFTATIAGDVTVDRMDSAFNNSGDGHIIINSGDVIAEKGIGLGQGNANDMGEITMNDGTLTVNSWGILVGYQNGEGKFTLNGGEVFCNAALRVGYGTWGSSEVTRGNVYINGGTFNANFMTLYDVG